SPIARTLNDGLPFDGVCPTAGTVVEGLEGGTDEGDVLVSIAPASDGRQLIWEGFPGANGETTVYLFYYDRTGANEASKQPLLELFEQYFQSLPSYRKPGVGFRHVRPVFGYIPARHGRTGRIAARGLLCLGDSAAGQSPLTFCGFGSFVRHVGRASMLISYVLEHNLLEEKHLRQISSHQPNLRVAWVFSRFMQPWPGSDVYAVNRLMNVFSHALSDLGPVITRRFLQDRYTFGEYVRIMLTTARHYPRVFTITARALGAFGLAGWASDITRFGASDLLRMLSMNVPRRSRTRLRRLIQKTSPQLALRLLAAETMWQATR
ncbi:MAG TPA: hypothetical protein VM409_00465, partial [Chloroflexia bacterium]|nr:hypothetical protein [Chloroflexia bacterium]